MEKLDHLNQPRELIVGHFIHADRTEIAAGTAEGDIVVFGYEMGMLREVGRIFNGSAHAEGVTVPAPPPRHRSSHP